MIGHLKSWGAEEGQERWPDDFRSESFQFASRGAFWRLDIIIRVVVRSVNIYKSKINIEY
jgi:hypothetical protein